jgi:hypothetical protein
MVVCVRRALKFKHIFALKRYESGDGAIFVSAREFQGKASIYDAVSYPIFSGRKAEREP